MAFDIGPISNEQWAIHRREMMEELPPALIGASIEDVLLGYQKRLLFATASHQLVATDKSRRIGATWAVGADAVLTAGAAKDAGGMDVLYIGYNLDMAREFIDTCAMWAKAFSPACTEVGEFLFDNGKDDAAIQAYRIRFASGFEITALSSRPRSLRGRQGYVILDEFAFHDNAEELLKAAMALLIWGGKVLVISTHNGVDNPFNQLINDIRAGKKGKSATVMRCTFDEALEDGLYQRICLVRGIDWTPEGEAEWRAGIYKIYGAAADEELACIPAQGSGVYLTRALIEACSHEAPVVRLKCGADFVMKPVHEREAFVAAWFQDQVAPLVQLLDKNLAHFLGQDFARSGDVSSLTPMARERNLDRRVPFVIEMRNVPYEQQKQIFFLLADALPRFSGAKIDSTGNGGYLGEVVLQRFGPELVEAVKLSQGWYVENMPPLKSAFEDRTILIPADVDLHDDLRQVKIIRGVAMVPPDAKTDGSDGLPRHGDFAVSLAMAYAASKGDGASFDYLSVGRFTALDPRGSGSALYEGPMPHRDDEGGGDTSLRRGFARGRTW